MIYLLAKYTLLFLFAVALGVLLGRWWIRRSFIDVTDSYSALEQAQEGTEQGWNKLWKRLDMLDGGIEPKVSSAFAALPQQAPTEVDLSGIEQRLGALERRLGQLPTTPAQPDFGPVISRIEGLEARMQQNLDTRLDSAVAKLTSSTPSETAAASVDLSPVSERIADLERYVRTLPRTDHQLDLSPIKLRLGAIEALLKSQANARGTVATRTPVGAPNNTSNNAPTRRPVGTHASSPATPQTVDSNPTAASTDGPTLFDSDSAGPRDDLKKISGIGPKLESLLNQNGVYYYWQIASWSDADVTFMDERLEAFKGRIERDNWVDQAQTFKALPNAAKAPS